MDTTTRSTSTTTADPNGATSSPATATNMTVTHALVPEAAPRFDTSSANATYANLTIDSFSPLIVYDPPMSIGTGAWHTPITDSRLSEIGTLSQRDWHLGTYMRSEMPNATIWFWFEGSELYLYGDRGPSYGAFSVQVDSDTTKELRSAYTPAQSMGGSSLLDAVRGLSEGRHKVGVTIEGPRTGPVEGSGFLLDYVVVRQRVGTGQPKISDVRGADLEKLSSWKAWTKDEVTEQQGQNVTQTKTIVSSSAKGESLTYSFSNATAVHVYGTRNATHGAYSVSLTSSSPSVVGSTTFYDGSFPCDFPNRTNNLTSCEWRGSVLKHAAANLDPAANYTLKLENTDVSGGGRIFDVDLIRTFGGNGVVLEPGSLAPGGSGLDRLQDQNHTHQRPKASSREKSMKFAFAPILGLLLCISTATAFVDYDEVDGRSFVDDLSVRGEAVAIPFQPSLRAFLEEAVTAHRRAIESTNELEARDSVSLMVAVRYGATAAVVPPLTDEGQFKRIAPLTDVVKYFTGRLKLGKGPFKLLHGFNEVDLSKKLNQVVGPEVDRTTFCIYPGKDWRKFCYT
ncbi:hypothetical protein DFP72DRAFT_1174899 [Ephemerocybe angulata]|uniref:Uncharacterized protein n=1 Tax=Ephemerocybe angulata TaxID=980116 RepID=A0A8H6HJ71_9AGAR|nr:hypothetical protein DFP72DRAFT_1174899 [Tulosesus angulatus]